MKRIILIISTVLCLVSLENYYKVSKEEIPIAIAKEYQNSFGINVGKNIVDDFSAWKNSSSYKYNKYFTGVTDTTYLEKGTKNGVTEKLTVLGKQLSINGLTYGMKIDEIKKNYPFAKKLEAVAKNRRITVNLSNDLLNERPLLYVAPYFYELHIDTVTKKLLGVSMYTFDGFLAERSYPFTYYSGSKLSKKKEIPTSKSYSNVMSDQVFDATVIVRQLYGKSVLKDQKSLEKVAFKHSLDMYNRNYFEHVSPDGGTLKNRLLDGEIIYMMAGENLAYNYDDSVRTVIGWLNSPGHRKNLLHKSYKKMGIGVYGPYITQNMIK